MLLEASSARCFGGEAFLGWLPEFSGTVVEDMGWSGIVDFRPDDLVVTVKGGTRLADLMVETASSGLGLPLVLGDGLEAFHPSGVSVGAWLQMGMPHLGQGEFGPIRDWVTGMTAMLSSGEVVKVGSTVVKSVAGYDLHRLMVGSRGTLGAILDVTLRLQPLARVGRPDVFIHPVERRFAFVSKVPSSSFEELVNGMSGVVAADCRSGIVWSTERPEDERVVWSMGPGGWLHPGPSEPVRRIQRRLRERFDPRGLWARGFAHE